MFGPLRCYDEGLTDSRRWAQVELRVDDIIISTPSKCGTTWAQMICALLILGTELPAPLTELSPWVDMRLRPLPDLKARLASQPHRRFLKTHTPLDGLPYLEGVSYLVVGRDPRDVAVSMDRHRANLDASVIEAGMPSRSSPETAHRLQPQPMTQRERVSAWIDNDEPPTQRLSSLKGMAWHLSHAWSRRDLPNVILLHYADLTSDLEGQMRVVAERLDLPISARTFPSLVEAASLTAMRAKAAHLAPDEGIGLFRDSNEFFGRGTTGQWTDVLNKQDEAAYQRRISQLVNPELLSWFHR